MNEQKQECIRRAKKRLSAKIIEARDYLTKEAEFLFDSQLPIEEVMKQMAKHSFVRWLRKEAGFTEASKKIVNKKLCIKKTSNERVNLYRENFALEGLCALLLHLFSESKNELKQAVVANEERNKIIKAMQSLHHDLTQGKLYFGNGVKQQVLCILLADLLKTPGYNPFSSKRGHDLLLRQAFTKFFIANFTQIYEGDTSKSSIADITLNITGIFFDDIMDKREIERANVEISATLHNENEFLKKTIQDIYLNSVSSSHAEILGQTQ
ncbi:MAG: hypothetical protein EBQ95_07525 [Gammaproteobacteria bacterium]|nr:hypothetical protein [Gammaproteobacteria bacterium]